MSSRPRPSSRLSVRFLLYYAVTYLILIGSLGWFVDRQVREALVEDLVAGLETSAEVARVNMPNQIDEMGAWAKTVFAAGEFRVTVIDTGGVVVADSHSDPTVMENHSTRPEVAAALAGAIGRDSRTSLSTGFAQHYVALPVTDGLVLRVSISERSVAERLAPIRAQILFASILIGLIGVAAVALLARRLALPIQQLTDATLSIAAGERYRRPARSSISEIDQLGMAISQLADDLGSRITQTESVSATLEIVLGALPQGTILVAADDDILYANPKAYQLLGAVPDSLAGLDPHRFQMAVREARDSRQPVDVLVDHGSPIRRLRGVATPFTDDSRILLIILDATDRERVASVRRDFVANASHEL
ncbi:MAG: HAMP domain-containing protein, partial [Acidimicrobiia bacterium]|nr:HAMP domain-containing protein [Acidimicrobiia bacterium]